MTMKYRAVIFDMDGTVLDTAGDLADSLNYALDRAGCFHAYDSSLVKLFFGSGIAVAAKRALALEAGAKKEELLWIGTPREQLSVMPDLEKIPEICRIFREYYPAHCSVKTGPYEGIKELLRKLRSCQVLTAVVSNKPDRAVCVLAEDYFAGLFDQAAGEQEGIRRKPFPDLTWKVMEKMGVSAAEVLYVGDSEIDLETAQNAGTDCAAVDWGFRSREFLMEHGAKRIVSSPEDIAKLVLD